MSRAESVPFRQTSMKKISFTYARVHFDRAPSNTKRSRNVIPIEDWGPLVPNGVPRCLETVVHSWRMCRVPELEQVGDAVDLVDVRVVDEDDRLRLHALVHRRQVERVELLDAV